MILVHNFRSFPEVWTASGNIRGTSIYASDVNAYMAQKDTAGSIFLVNGDPQLVLRLASELLFARRRPLIVIDIVLRTPETFAGKIQLPLKRLLLNRVDHFLHYFRDIRGLHREFHIDPQRSAYIPFKVNLVTRHALNPHSDGEYVLCFGRSMRDYDTFLDAMEQLPYPGAIARPNLQALAAHHGRFTRPLDRLPKNIRILEDDGTEASEIEILSHARLLVLPILKKSLVASGISTCLNAMYLGKCILGSEGPGMSDIFNGEILTFPPEDTAALAALIQRAWEDDALRQQVAGAGHRFAVEAGAEPQLYQRIIDQVAVWYPQGVPV